MNKKIIFLDIDGVLQPFTQHRFDYMEEKQMQAMYDRLEKEHQRDYRKYHNGYYKGYNKYDVAAVVYDWDLEAIRQLKRVLDTTNAKIVLSSAWRKDDMEGMQDLFRIHQLDDYFIDVTPNFLYENLDEIADRLSLPRKTHARAIEILYYLKQHPEITHYVVIDDMRFGDDIPEHFVETDRSLTACHANKCIEILNKEHPVYLWQVAGDIIKQEKSERAEAKTKEEELNIKAMPYTESFHEQVNLDENIEGSHYRCEFNFFQRYMDDVSVFKNNSNDFDFEKDLKIACVINYSEERNYEVLKKLLYVYDEENEQWLEMKLRKKWRYQVFRYQERIYILEVNNYKEELATAAIYYVNNRLEFDLLVHYSVEAPMLMGYKEDKVLLEREEFDLNKEFNDVMTCRFNHDEQEFLTVKLAKRQWDCFYVKVFNSTYDILGEINWVDYYA